MNIFVFSLSLPHSDKVHQSQQSFHRNSMKPNNQIVH